MTRWLPGATAVRVADRMAISLRKLQRWRRQFTVHDAGGGLLMAEVVANAAKVVRATWPSG